MLIMFTYAIPGPAWVMSAGEGVYTARSDDQFTRSVLKAIRIELPEEYAMTYSPRYVSQMTLRSLFGGWLT